MPSRQHRLPKLQANSYANSLGITPIVRTDFSQSAPDGVSDLFVAEYKTRARLPALVTNALDQVSSHLPQFPGRIPIAILHAVHAQHSSDVVCIRLSDFTRLVELVTRSPSPREEGANTATFV